MKGPYDVLFDDGSLERVEAENADDAKRLAKSKRIRDLDPSGTRPRPDVLSHGSVKVAAVKEAVARTVTLLLVALAGALALYLDTVFPLAIGDVQHAGVLSTFGASGTAIGATLAALAAVTGDSLQIPFFPESKRAWLVQLWADVQVAGTLRVRSPKFHDNVNGIRVDTVIGDLHPILPFGAKQPLFPGDVLSVELAGSAVLGDIEYAVFLAYFEELAGQRLNGITWDQLMTRTQDIVTVENTIATGTTAAWAGSEAINAEIDQFQTRTEYAILGFVADAEAAAIAYRGPDFGNLRVGGPAEPGIRHVTAEWFVRLAQRTGLPVIPVFSADNKAATFIDSLQDENGTDTTITTVLARLRAA